VNYESAAPIYEKVCNVPQDRPFEIFIPQESLKPGLLYITLTTATPSTGSGADERYSIITSLSSGIQIGVVEDSFSICLLKSFLLLALQGWILALIMTGWSGVLSFSVAVAMGFILLLGGELSQQAIELMKRSPADTVSSDSASSKTSNGRDPNESSMSELSEQVTDAIIKVLEIFPDFQNNGGPAAFVEGKRTSFQAILAAVFWMGLIRGLGWALPGILLFQRREVGR
jgi:hypothetical protein